MQVNLEKKAWEAVKYHKPYIFTLKWKIVPDNFSTFPLVF